MSLDLSVQDKLREQKHARDAERAKSSDTPRGGGGREPPDDPGLEQRFRALEGGITAIDKSLAVISEQLKHVALQKDVAEIRTEVATITGKLDLKANATDVAELKGRVARIPTVPTLVAIGLLISLVFAAGSWAARHLPAGWLS